MGRIHGDSTPHAPGDGANQAGSFFAEMKPPLTFEQQLALMRERGLVIGDESEAIARLADSGYYRLRGYWLTYERGGRFIPGTTLDAIWDAYRLDAELRGWVWHAIAPIEIKARTLFSYHMSIECGAMAHEDSHHFRSARAHAGSMRSLERERDRALKDGVPCVVHNMEKYGGLPIWAAVEIMSMGTVSQLYGNLDSSRSDVQGLVAGGFGVKPYILKSWLRHLTYIRNICGHHSRLYNRVMTIRANLLRMDARNNSDKEFPTFVVLKRIYERSWPDEWPRMLDGLESILREHDDVPLAPMGFPVDWHEVLRG